MCVGGFLRPGSIIVDFIITTTTDELDFASANSALTQILTANGFKVVENSFAYSGKCLISFTIHLLYHTSDFSCFQQLALGSVLLTIEILCTHYISDLMGMTFNIGMKRYMKFSGLLYNS